MKMYSAHLRRQYDDRTLYWQSRAASRLNAMSPDSTQRLSVICDGMDHSKFKYPRSLSMLSKEFDALLRPHLNMHACLAHGHMCLLALSEMTVPKDASFCLDVLSYCLNQIADRLDLRATCLEVQSDNTCREMKNMSTLRLMALWVATRRLWSCDLRCLQKGHSHEDVDAFFANVAVAVEKHNELHRPASFQAILQQYLDAGARKHEPLKEVVLVDEVRDWHLVTEEMDRFSSVLVVWGAYENIDVHISNSPNSSNLCMFCCGATLAPQLLRATFLNVAVDGAHLKGVGGAGAPHLFRLERFVDTGAQSKLLCVQPGCG